MRVTEFGGDERVGLRREALLFGRYLARQTPSEELVERYVHVLQNGGPKAAGNLSPTDARLLDFARRHPRSIGWLDAGLALIHPAAELRRRLYLMFAILEASPEFAPRFLPRQRSVWYVPYILLVGLRAGVRAAGGIILVKVVS